MPIEERDLIWLRRQFVIALAADESLFELLVFKGGNALALAHGIGMRASLDLDYSLSREAHDGEDLGASLELALTGHLRAQGLVLFDWRFGPRPKSPRDDLALAWGGYLAEFKVIENTAWEALAGDLELARKLAWGISAGGGAGRRFRVELSRSEYCEGAREKEFGEGHVVRVYTPEMIAAEKLRSVCQQMPEYEHSTRRKARARDFYDIHAIVTEAGVNLTSVRNRDLVRSVFAAKGVPLRLLELVPREVGFHSGEWDAVRDSIPADKPQDFEYYTRFVVGILRRLKPLWMEDAP